MKIKPHSPAPLARNTNRGEGLGARHWPDAFGLRTAGWSGTSFNGEWLNSAGQAGTMHNTKNYDSDVELVYMFQRWYLPETGTFLSSAPYPPMMEHR